MENFNFRPLKNPGACRAAAEVGINSQGPCRRPAAHAAVGGIVKLCAPVLSPLYTVG